MNGLGVPNKNDTYDGLLAIIGRNETIAIPKVETFSPRLAVTRFTLPYGINGYLCHYFSISDHY